MRQVTEYFIVDKSSSGGVEDEVNEKLAEGWQPYGPALISGSRVMQPMVKYVDELQISGSEEPVIVNVMNAKLNVKG